MTSYQCLIYGYCYVLLYNALIGNGNVQNLNRARVFCFLTLFKDWRWDKQPSMVGNRYLQYITSRYETQDLLDRYLRYTAVISALSNPTRLQGRPVTSKQHILEGFDLWIGLICFTIHSANLYCDITTCS